MSDFNDEKIEYKNKKNSEEKSGYNRHAVDNIKRFIMVTLVCAFAIPFLFCIYLTIRINRMEEMVGQLYTAPLTTQSQLIEETTENDEDLEILDQYSNEDLEISVSQNNMLASSPEDTGYSDGSVEIDSSDEEVQDETAVISNGKKVYLTFDDGPSDNTAEILDILKKNNVKATFFVVYNSDKELWPMYERIVDEGHTLGMHSYSHVYDLVYSDLDSFKADITGIHDFLLDRTGVDCHFYRFPGGSSNSVSNVDIQELIGYLNEEGITYYDWNSLSGDAVSAGADAATLNANILNYVRNNSGDSIVLMHDIGNCDGTVEGLQDLIDTLKQEGYTLCAIDDDTIPVQHVSYDSEGTE